MCACKCKAAGALARQSLLKDDADRPAIAWWPGVIPPHTVTTALASTLDIFATFLELGHAQTPAVVLDSHSLVPILRDPAKERG